MFLTFPATSHEDSVGGGGAEGGMEFWASIFTVTFGTIRTADLSAQRASRTLSPGKFIGTHFSRGRVDVSATECEHKD
jgi:hypothetical protein